MKAQAYIVSLYSEGERRPSDCVPFFLPTREAAEAEGKLWLRDADSISALPWAVRYTVRRISIDI